MLVGYTSRNANQSVADVCIPEGGIYKATITSNGVALDTLILQYWLVPYYDTELPLFAVGHSPGPGLNATITPKLSITVPPGLYTLEIVVLSGELIHPVFPLCGQQYLVEVLNMGTILYGG